MNFVALLEPLAAMAPSGMRLGASALVPDADQLQADLLVPAIRATLHGVAGDEIAGTLEHASRSVSHALGAGTILDGIAGRASQAVEAAIRDITQIAQQCLAEVVQHIVQNASSVGPASAFGAAGVVPIVEEHKLQAQERLGALGTEMHGLTQEVSAVQFAQAPGLDAPVSPASAALPAAPPSEVSTPQPARPSFENAGMASSDMTGSSSEAPNPQAAAAVEAAKSALGTPYQWGGNTPGVGLDCSGLTKWAYAQAGVDIPRTADQQAIGMQVSMDQLAPGDLVVWDGHVAMYIGDGQIIEAGDPVQINPVRTDNIGMNFLGFYRPTA